MFEMSHATVKVHVCQDINGNCIILIELYANLWWYFLIYMYPSYISETADRGSRLLSIVNTGQNNEMT